MMVGRLAPLVPCAIVIWGISTSAFAQEKPLLVESSSIQPSVVLGRPMLTWWDVKIRGNALFTGTLQFSIKSDDLLLATLETEELTLNGPEQRIRVMLPAVDPGFPLDRLNVEISFEGKKFSGKVSDQILRIPFSSKKVYVMLVGESKNLRKRPSRDQTIERLRFENLVPEMKDQQGKIVDREYVKTLVASIDPADFPAEPMSYCSYDVVALMGEEFRNLRKPQLEALLTWIKAGGSLYVEPNGVLQSYHVEFLQNLVAEDPQSLDVQLTTTGRLPPDTVPPGQTAAVRKRGLGNVAIRIDDPDHEEQFKAEDWRPVISPLWKMRRVVTEAPMIPYNKVGPNGEVVQEYMANPDPWGLAALSYDRFRLPQNEVLDRLMPDNVQMVPMSVLALVLFAFVVVIGPGDYFVLGWLRSRSLTWLTFPVATIAVTALTVCLSNAYMSQAETRRAVVVCDVGPSGDVVRTNRFELLFVASSHRVATEVQKGMLVALSLGTSLANSPLMPPRAFAPPRMRQAPPKVMYPDMDASGSENDPPIVLPMTTYQGRLPTQFSVPQDLVKWTPQLNRVFSIPGAVSKPEIDWDVFNLKLDEIEKIRQHEVPQLIRDRVRTQFGPQAMVACFVGKDGWAYDKATAWFSSRSNGQDVGLINYYRSRNAFNGNLEQAMGESPFFRWIYQASIAMPKRTFLLTSNTSPKGGTVCDDLPLLDSSDPKTWLLVVVVPEKVDFTVYRKVMQIRD